MQGDVSDSEENQAKAINIEEVANRKEHAQDDPKEDKEEQQTDEKEDNDNQNEEQTNLPSYQQKIEELKKQEEDAEE